MERRFVSKDASGKSAMDAAFFRHNRYQIVSPGIDRKLGHGGLWPLRDFPRQNGDRDNLTNFAEGRLEAGR